MRPSVTVQVPPEPPDTERCPVGPSTERRSCHSACVRSGDAWKGQTAAVNPTLAPLVCSPPNWATAQLNPSDLKWLRLRRRSSELARVWSSGNI